MLQPPLQLPFGNSAKDHNSYSSCIGLPIIEVLCSSIDLSFCHKRWVDYYKTTARFGENISSFWEKQRIVLVKTTYRFEKNNVSFWEKQRVVLWEVTCCFQTTIGCRKSYRWATHQKQSFPNCKKNLQSPPLARTRTRTSQDFLHFCCHKCHSTHHNTLYSKPLRKPYTHFNEQTI